jgi:hypothetical protein
VNRWTLSLHEAGHAVAIYALTGAPATATLHEAGGATWPSVDMTATDRAIMTAAGPLAESLTDRYPAPELPPAVARRPPTAETIATIETATALRREMRQAVADPVVLARFCIEGIEDQPARWAQRHAWIRSVAERLIRSHERSIVNAARVLYLRGVVSLPLDERNAL